MASISLPSVDSPPRTKVIIPPAGLSVKRQRVRRRVVELQAPPVLLPHVLASSRRHIEEGIRVHSATQQSRAQSREMQKVAEMDRQTEEKLRQIRESSEEGEAFVKKFIEADFLFHPRCEVEHKDTHLEPKLFTQARELFSQDPYMKEDFARHHIGEVELRPRTAEEQAEEADRRRFVNIMTRKQTIVERVNKEMDRIKSVSKEGVRLSEEARSMQEMMDAADHTMSFEAKAQTRLKVLSLKRKANDLMAEAANASDDLEDLRVRLHEDLEAYEKEQLLTIQQQHAHHAWKQLGNLVLAQNLLTANTQGQSLAPLPSTSTPTRKRGRTQDLTAGPIVAWFIAMASREGVIDKLYYGSFSSSDDPPLEGWLTLTNQDNQARRCPDLVLKAKDLGLTVDKPRSRFALAKPGTGGGTSTDFVKKWTVSGADYDEVNAIYIEDGQTDGVLRYTSPSGISIFRRHLAEIPELGITLAAVQADLEGQRADTPLINRENVEEPASLTFNELHRVSTRMVTADIVNRLFRRQQQQAQCERRKEENFRLKLKQASAELQQVQGVEGGDDPSRIVVDDDDAADVAMLVAPNLTFQTRPEEIQLKGADLLVPSEQKPPPPLCMKWVFLSCPKDRAVCLNRHYYVTEEEKFNMISLRQRREVQLEIKALSAITEREAVLDEVQQESKMLQKRFLSEHDQALQLPDVYPLLNKLDHIRMLTVITAEAIVAWQKFIKAQRQTMQTLVRAEREKEIEEQARRDAEEEAKTVVRKEKKAKTDKVAPDSDSANGGYIVMMTVQGGELYGPSPACPSSFKRYQRGEKPPKRATKIVYLGIYDNKEDAFLAYDMAMQREAERLRVPVSRMPHKQFRLRPCGKHYAVETSGASKMPCEQCLVRQLGAGAEFTCTFTWNGENYLLKMAKDLGFLNEVDPVRMLLGPSFTFTSNPLLLDMKGLEDRTKLMETPEFGLSPALTISTGSGSRAGTAISQVSRLSTASYRFGTPGTSVVKLKNGLHQWGEQRTRGTRFIVTDGDDFARDPYLSISEDQLSLPTEHIVEVVSLDRVMKANKVLQEELSLVTLLKSAKYQRSLSKGPSKPKKKLHFHDVKRKLKLEVPKYPTGSSMILKDAVYSYKGVRLAITQDRFPLPYRDPLIWCRSDVGEWKGLFKGRAMRSHDYQIERRVEARLMKKRRTMVAHLLRREIAKDVFHADFELIDELLAVAETIAKGSSLETDVYNTKLYLLQCKTIFTITKWVQRHWRGFEGRRRYDTYRAMKRGAQQFKFLYDHTVAMTATNYVREIMKISCKNVATRVRSPEIKTLAFIEKEHYIASVLNMEHQDFMTQSTIATDARLCTGCRRANPMMAYDLMKQQYTLRFPACTCTRERTPERWCLRFYEPIQSRTLSITVAEAYIRERVLIEQSEGTITASQEVLDACHLSKSVFGVIDELLGYTKSTRFDVIRAYCYRIASYKRARDRWEPLRETRVLKGMLDFSRTIATEMQKRADNATAKAQSARVAVELQRMVMEQAYMAFEDKRRKFLTTVDLWQDAIAGTTRALAFAKEGLINFENMVKLDWRQSWDPFENGNDWIQLRYKRRRERDAIIAREESLRAHLNVFLEVQNYDVARYMADKEEKLATKAVQGAAQLWELYRLVVEAHRRASYMSHEVMQHMLQMVIMRRLNVVPARMAVIIRQPLWAKISDGPKRTGREFGKAWDLMHRAIRQLKAPYGYDAVSGVPDVRQVRLLEKQKAKDANRLIKRKKEAATKNKRGKKDDNKPEKKDQDNVEAFPKFIVSIHHDRVSGYILLKAYRPGAIDSKEVVISPREMRIILETHGPSLLAPIVLPFSDFAMERKARKDRMKDICEVLLSEMKMNIYGNLTVGDIAFLRKVYVLQDIASKSMWFRDSAAWRSSAKGTEVYRGTHKTGTTYMQYAVYEKWGDLLLEAYCPSDAMVYIRYLTLQDLIWMFRRPETSLHLRAYLNDVRTMAYSPDVLRLLLDQLDFTLPGEEGYWWHRRHFRQEVPTFIKRPYGDKGYRGPVYRTRRYVSHNAVEVSFYESPLQGIKITVAADPFGPKSFHYGGPSIALELSAKGLRKLLIHWPDQDILHPSRKGELFDILADRLEMVEVPERVKDIWAGINRVVATAAEIYCTLQGFARWAVRYKVPISYQDMVMPEGEPWFTNIIDEAKREVQDRPELISESDDGKESKVMLNLRLRSVPDPDAARLLVCQQAISTPEKAGTWIKDAKHMVFMVYLESPLMTKDGMGRTVVRVRRQTALEISREREELERRQMIEADIESRKFNHLVRLLQEEQRRLPEEANQNKRLKDMQSGVTKLIRLNKLHLSRCHGEHQQAQKTIRQQSLESIKSFVPLLRKLIYGVRQPVQDDGVGIDSAEQKPLIFGISLQGTSLPSSSVLLPLEIGKEQVEKSASRPSIEHRRTRNKHRVGREEEENEAVMKMGHKTLSFGAQVALYGGARCIVDIFYYSDTNLLEVSIYEPSASRTYSLYLSGLSIPVIWDLLEVEMEQAEHKSGMQNATGALATMFKWKSSKMANHASEEESKNIVSAPHGQVSRSTSGNKTPSNASTAPRPPIAEPPQAGAKSAGHSKDNEKGVPLSPMDHKSVKPIPKQTTSQPPAKVEATSKKGGMFSFFRTGQPPRESNDPAPSRSDKATNQGALISPKSVSEASSAVNNATSHGSSSSVSTSSHSSGNQMAEKAHPELMNERGLIGFMKRMAHGAPTVSSVPISSAEAACMDDPVLRAKVTEENLFRYWATIGFDRARLKQMSVDVADGVMAEALYRAEMVRLRKAGREAIVTASASRYELVEGTGKGKLVAMAAIEPVPIDAKAEHEAWLEKMKRIARVKPKPVPRKRPPLIAPDVPAVMTASPTTIESSRVKLMTIGTLFRIGLFVNRLRWRAKANRGGHSSFIEGSDSIQVEHLDMDSYARWLAPCLLQCFQQSKSVLHHSSYDPRPRLIDAIRETVEHHVKLNKAEPPALISGLVPTVPPSPYALWVKLLVIHYTMCTIPPGACPVMLCRKMRTEILQPDNLEQQYKSWLDEYRQQDEKSSTDTDTTRYTSSAPEQIEPAMGDGIMIESSAQFSEGETSDGPLPVAPAMPSGEIAIETCPDGGQGIPGDSYASPNIACGVTKPGIDITAKISSASPSVAVLAIERCLSDYYIDMYHPAVEEKRRDTRCVVAKDDLPPPSLVDYLDRHPELSKAINHIPSFKESMKEKEDINEALDSHPTEETILQHCPLGILPSLPPPKDLSPLDSEEGFNLPLARLDAPIIMEPEDADRRVGLSWEQLRQELYQDGMDYYTYVLRRIRFGRKMECKDQLFVSSLDEAYQAHITTFECLIGQVVLPVDKKRIICEVLVPELENSVTKLLVRSYTPETRYTTELAIDVPTLVRLLPSKIISSSLRWLHADDDSKELQYVDMVCLGSYLVQHLDGLIGIHEVGKITFLYLQDDMKERRKHGRLLAEEGLSSKVHLGAQQEKMICRLDRLRAHHLLCIEQEEKRRLIERSRQFEDKMKLRREERKIRLLQSS